MNILYQFNDKYAPYAGVSMTSLLENNKEADVINIYVLGENLSDDSVSRFKELERNYSNNGKTVRHIEFIDSSALVEKMKSLNMPTYRGSYAANMRLFIGDIEEGMTFLEKDQGKGDRRLLYLDADTVVTGSLTDIYNSDIKTLGMVYDTLAGSHKYEIGLEKEDGYYNSGVILFDLDKWKDGDYTGKIVEHVKNVRAQYPSPDQDLINVVVRDEISPLPVSCNFQPHLRDYSYISFMKAFHPYPFYSGEEVTKANGEPIILHAFRYIGEFCWHRGNLHPFNKEFDKYLAISPWSDYEKRASGTGLVMKIEKMMYKVLPKTLFLRIFTGMHGLFYKNADDKSKKNVISKAM